MASDRAETGFYCSTSGTYFSDKESLAEHYKSDFHRYNLKRKVAGLPPVTKEWFEARKAQLTTASTAPHQRVWYDPLTKKKFQTQNTYQAHVNSKKYQELVRQSGQPAPAPVIMIKQLQQDTSSATPNGAPAKAAPAGFTVKAPHRKAAADQQQSSEEEEEDFEDDDSGWETASDDEEEGTAAAGAGFRGSSKLAGLKKAAAAAGAAAGAADGAAAAAADGAAAEGEDEAEDDWEEWDVCVSLFDNKHSASMQENLEYMYKNFGFYLPDAEFLVNPEGLLKYLGAKLQYGKVPLYTAGDDPNAKQFRSLHAVQRHMVDTNQCKMLYDDNEEEYEDFYDYSKTAAEGEGAAAEGAESHGLTLSTAMGGLSLGPGSSSAAGWELTVGGSADSGASAAKALGSRELAKYYRQRPKPIDSRQSVAVNSIVAQYRSMGIDTKDTRPPEGEKRAQKDGQRAQRQWLNLAMRTNINNNLPKNVPY